MKIVIANPKILLYLFYGFFEKLIIYNVPESSKASI